MPVTLEAMPSPAGQAVAVKFTIITTGQTSI